MAINVNIPSAVKIDETIVTGGTNGKMLVIENDKVGEADIPSGGGGSWDGIIDTTVISLGASTSITETLNGSKYTHHFHLPSVASGANTFPNYFAGHQAGQSLAGAGYANAGIGKGALKLLNGSEENSSSNVAFGYNALSSMVFGTRNVAIGVAAMAQTPSGSSGAPIMANVAIGHHAYINGGGNYQIAIGTQAMENSTSTTITDVIAIGQFALRDCNANHNIGIGYQNQQTNNVGDKNVSLGWNCAAGVPAGSTGFTENTLVGFRAGGGNASAFSGGYNTFIGSLSGAAITSGVTNTGVGRSSLSSLTTGDANLAFGINAGNLITTGQSNIIIGNYLTTSAPNANHELNIGNIITATSIDNPSNVLISLGTNFKVKGNGKLNATSLPTSATGLVTGDIWNDSGTLKIV